MLSLRMPSRDEALRTTRYHPVFAVRVPKQILDITHMLSELTGRTVSQTKKLIVFEGALQILQQSKLRETDNESA